MSEFQPADDLRPVPPVQPDDSECCRSGCDPCIFDLFAEEMEQYRAQLRAWEERQAGKSKDTPAD